MSALSVVNRRFDSRLGDSNAKQNNGFASLFDTEYFMDRTGQFGLGISIFS